MEPRRRRARPALRRVPGCRGRTHTGGRGIKAIHKSVARALIGAFVIAGCINLAIFRLPSTVTDPVTLTVAVLLLAVGLHWFHTEFLHTKPPEDE